MTDEDAKDELRGFKAEQSVADGEGYTIKQTFQTNQKQCFKVLEAS